MIGQNLEIISGRIEKACKKSGKNADEIRLIAVTKTIPPEVIGQAYDHGVRDFGENKVQELVSKIDKTPNDINWHFIGHLQRNKVKQIRNFVHLIHSVDSLSLATEINKNAGEVSRKIPVLIQVNTSNEESKFGIDPDKAIELVKESAVLPNIKIMGLMTIGAFVEDPPLFNDPEKVRPYFKKLKELFESIQKLNIDNIEMKHLSMGMTNDFEVAIEEGSTMIRIGTAIFGSRN